MKKLTISLWEQQAWSDSLSCYFHVIFFSVEHGEEELKFMVVIWSPDAIILEHTARFLAHISAIFISKNTEFGIVLEFFFNLFFLFLFFFLETTVLFINAYQDWVFLVKSLLLSVTLYNHAFSFSFFFKLPLSANACLSAVWRGEEPFGSVHLVWRMFSGQKNFLFLHPCPITKLQQTRKENFVNQNSQLGNH